MSRSSDVTTANRLTNHRAPLSRSKFKGIK